jgi:tetratricopeptide (TPR) repeat protein
MAEAEACLRRAVALDPASGPTYRFLGNVLRELGRFDEAIPLLEQASALTPDEVGIYYDLVQSKRLTEAERPLIFRLRGSRDAPPRHRENQTQMLNEQSSFNIWRRIKIYQLDRRR